MSTPERFQVFVSSISYFSGKFEAYIRYIGLPHDRHELTMRTFRNVLENTGVQKMPAAQCPDGRWLKDTTPMIDYLDREIAAVSVYPEDPAERFLSLLVEDYADEWMWRPALHYRWSYPDTRALLARRIERDLIQSPALLKPLARTYLANRQRSIYTRGDGVRSHNRAAIEAIYLDTLATLEDILRRQDFLGGERPSIVDFGFYASMWRHFGLDPEPASIMQQKAPGVFAWLARVWNARSDALAEGSFASLMEEQWRPVWRSVANAYLPYLDQNAVAWKAGKKRFDAVANGVPYPRVPAVQYRVACREQLLKAWRGLSDEVQADAKQRIPIPSVTDWFETAADIPSGLEQEFEMPLKPRYQKSSGLYALKTLQGTPWDMVKGAVKD